MVSSFILLLTLVLIVLPIWSLFRIISLGNRNEELEQRLRALEREFNEHRSAQRSVAPLERPEPVAAPVALPPAAPPLISLPPLPRAMPVESLESAAPSEIELPPLVAAVTRSRFNWEQFTGAKLLAWTGGAAAFLGAAFFIKYSFEHDLISPAMRVAIGYVFALALVIGGLRIPRPRYAPTAQTVCATGIVCLYAVTFACSSIYEFAFFTPLRSFLLMALITAAAFVLAVRLGARVVAVLGMLGGFLTPVLLSTGRDNAFGLFGYIALLDIGLVALALHQRWLFLVPLGAAGTIAMQLGWAVKFLTPAKAPTAMVICLAFCAIFLAAYVIARRFATGSAGLRSAEKGTGAIPASPSAGLTHFFWPAITLPCVALLFALGFIGYPTIAAQPGLLFSFVFAADACLLAIAWLDEDSPHLHLLGGLAAFTLLALWTGVRLTDNLMPWALGLYLVHGVVHTSFPLLLERRRPGVTTWLSQLFPPLALVLMLVPFFKLEAVSFALWPCVLLVDLLAIGLAVFTGSIVAVATALVLTLVATTLWMFRLPPALGDGSSLLFVVGGFAALFFAAGIALDRRTSGLDTAGLQPSDDRRANLPAFSVLMPFVLLVLMTQRLPTASPSGVFGLALLLVLLCLGLTARSGYSPDPANPAFSAPPRDQRSGLTRRRGERGEKTIGSGWTESEHYMLAATARALNVSWLPTCALAGVATLEFAWDARHATRSFADPPFTWQMIFYAAFAIFPFAFRTRFAAMTGPWAAAALVGVLQFPLVYRMLKRAAPNDVMGMVPALFAIAPLVSLLAIRRLTSTNERARLSQLAWFGGVALFFITLIFPIQFEREWITLGWALEGTALLWLFRRVPHPGLRATGVVLLVAAFVRLALNPAVLEYHARASTPILNWYLYGYGIVTACLFAGATLLPAGQHRALGFNARPLLYSLGTVLAFLLLNIQIADFFSPPGTRVLTFQFSGNFGRDMTYTIAWALFALALLLVSIWKHTRAGRYAALALLGVAVLKLFIHDLERLGALHRIGALFAVAIIAIAASLAYQRFLPGDDSSEARRDR